MRKRNHDIKIRLSDEELEYLESLVKKTGLSRESYIRNLINLIVPNEMPSEEFLDTIKQLRRIGNNLNQIAISANRNKWIDIVEYRTNVAKLQKEILKIKQIISEKRKVEMIDGYDEDMAD